MRKLLGTLLGILLRLLCYGGLLLVLAAIVAFLVVQGDCPRFDSGAVQCNTPLAQDLGNFALGVMLLTAFTGLPLLFALGGLRYLWLDVRAWRRRRAGATP